MEPEQGNALVRLTARFNEHEFTVVDVDGVPMISARQVGEALGYARPDQVATNISSDWSDDLLEGTDYRVLRGAELAAVKAAAPDLVDPRAPSLLLLTRSGVDLVLLLSRQPAAKQLRRWLVDEVFPKLRDTGRYELAPSPAPAILTLDPAALSDDLRDAPAGCVVELLLAEQLAGRELVGLREQLHLAAEGRRKEQRAKLRSAEVDKNLEATSRRYSRANEWGQRVQELIGEVRHRYPEAGPLKGMPATIAFLNGKLPSGEEKDALLERLEELRWRKGRLKSRTGPKTDAETDDWIKRGDQALVAARELLDELAGAAEEVTRG